MPPTLDEALDFLSNEYDVQMPTTHPMILAVRRVHDQGHDGRLGGHAEIGDR